MQAENARLNFVEIPVTVPAMSLDTVVSEGLSARQKWLSSRFFYDTAGSELFERICKLPEYYLTRTERAILDRHIGEMIETIGSDISIVEFGSGSSCKTRLLLEAALAQQATLHYLPIDISARFLRLSAVSLLEEYDRLTVTAIAAEYYDGIAALPASDVPRLILFLGSSIGNFTHLEACEFLSHIRRQMQPQDRLLIGIDLLKERSRLYAAYNDAEGVTAAFNKNLLKRINADMGADFDTEDFVHAAPFVEAEARIEMHLESRRSHCVSVKNIGRVFHFRKGETIHTENSHKYSLSSFASLCRQAGLDAEGHWTDDSEWFALVMLKAQG